MKTVYCNSVIKHSALKPCEFSFSPIPDWVSSMGLEWLYQLLLQVEQFWHRRSPQA